MSRGDRPYEVVLTRAAARVLRKLPKTEVKRLVARAESLAGNPRPVGVEKLTDRGDLYRVRVGDYRIVYRINDEARTVDVETIGDRKDVYRE